MHTTIAQQQGFTLLHLYIIEGIKAIAIEKLLTSMKLVSTVYGIELFIAFVFSMVSLSLTITMSTTSFQLSVGGWPCDFSNLQKMIY